MYLTQCVERGLAFLATVTNPRRKFFRGSKRFETMIDFYSAKTLGALIREMPERKLVADGLRTKLREVAVKRNWLAHNYFWSRAALFMSKEGRAGMILELSDLADYIESVNDELTTIMKQWGAAHGLTTSVIDAVMEDLIRREAATS